MPVAVAYGAHGFKELWKEATIIQNHKTGRSFQSQVFFGIVTWLQTRAIRVS